MDEKVDELKDEKEMTKITLSLKEETEKIAWTRKGKEFRYENQMYDVVKTEKGNNKITIYCIADKDEKAYQDHFCMLLKKNTENDKKIKKIKKNNLSKSNKNISYNKLIIAPCGQIENAVTLNYVSLFGIPLSPPPEFT